MKKMGFLKMMSLLITIYKVGAIFTFLYFGYLIIENILFQNNHVIFSAFKKSTVLIDIICLFIISILWLPVLIGIVLFKMHHKRNVISILIFAFVISFMCMPDYSFLTKNDLKEFYTLKSEYNWLNIDLYETLLRETKKNNIPIGLSCSLIQSESGGRNVISRENTNGTRDYGYCQVNSVHSPNDPEKLLNSMYNIKLSCNYLGRAFEKAKKLYDTDDWYKESIRMYNQGLYGKRYAYNNWNYVNKTVNRYISFTNNREV